MDLSPIKREVSLGMILHTVGVLATICVMYGQFSAKFAAYEAAIDNVSHQTTRIEHYLSSQDKEYWHKVNENGDTTK